MSYELVKKQDRYLLSDESAHDVVMEILTHYDIDITHVPELVRAINVMKDYIRQGVLEIKRDDTTNALIVVHHLVNGATVEYSEINAQAKLAMDKAGTAQYTRMYAFMGSLSKLGTSAIEKFSARDLSVVEIVGTVFSNA